MELRPLDVLNQRFRRTFRGYDASEVETFLKQVAEVMERSLAEVVRLRAEVADQQHELDRYRQVESTLSETLVLAQKTADDLRANAEKEAELIVREARDGVKGDLADARQELETLSRTRDRFAAELRALLHSYMDLIEGAESGRRLGTEPEHGD